MLPGQGGAALRGAGGAPIVTLAASYTFEDVRVSPTNASAGFSLQADGDIISVLSGGNSDQGDWVVPRAAAGAGYEAQMTTISGTLTSGTAGSWLSLGGGALTWAKTRTSDTPGTDAYSGTLEIRDAATLAVLDAATVTLNATVAVDEG